MTRRASKHPSKPGTRKAASHEVAGQGIPARADGALVWAMVALSGFACLIYQILWMRQLGLLFGNTSHAAALTLAVFFGGLAAGGAYWGGRCAGFSKPLRVYACLEAGIAAWGVLILLAPGMVDGIYPLIYQRHGPGFVLTTFNVCLTLLMVFPAAAMMGGTLPVLGQAVIRHASAFGATASRLYAINTLGAAAGAFAAAFVLISTLGVRMTCVVAMTASAMSAALAWGLSRQAKGGVERRPEKMPHPSPGGAVMSRGCIRCLAFLSGFNLLALEVVWTRMMAQIHENSVYSFSTILIVVLACLSGGAWFASRLSRWKSSPAATLVVLIALGGTALSILPFVFTGLTRNMSMLPTDTHFAAYVWHLFGTAFMSIGLPCFLLGTVFPYLMKSEEAFAVEPGKSIGGLTAINTLGAILGALAAGFVLLEWLGLWRSVQWIAVGYLAIALLVPTAKSDLCRAVKSAAGVIIVLSLTLMNPARIPSPVTLDHHGKPEKLIEKLEAGDATVSVVRDSQDQLAIKINSHYSLGSSYAIVPQIHQARIPLLAFPHTDSVFFLGLGTGITAGEALDRESYPLVSRVTACELLPAVVAASKKHFAGGTGGEDMTRGLYRDPRARIIIADGRKHLMADGESHSMINADLFLPYQRGAGSLYSLEHFRNVKERLEPGGVFVQWLPLYQMSEREFGVIARTMISVFPQVSLWRGNFQPGAEIAALVGHADDTPLAASGLDVEKDKRAAVAGATHRDMHQLMLPINEETILWFYAGNVGNAAGFFENHPLNTDDRPVIEFGTPRSLHQPADEGKPHFLAGRFADLVDRLLTHTPPDEDPLLSARSMQGRKLPLAGSAFHRAWISSAAQDEEAWKDHWDEFIRHWTGS